MRLRLLPFLVALGVAAFLGATDVQAGVMLAGAAPDPQGLLAADSPAVPEPLPAVPAVEACQNQSGGSMQPTSYVSSHGPSNAHVGIVIASEVQSDQTVTRFLVEEAASLPDPFPSGLFHPPRWS